MNWQRRVDAHAWSPATDGWKIRLLKGYKDEIAGDWMSVLGGQLVTLGGRNLESDVTLCVLILKVEDEVSLVCVYCGGNAEYEGRLHK